MVFGVRCASLCCDSFISGSEQRSYSMCGFELCNYLHCLLVGFYFVVVVVFALPSMFGCLFVWNSSLHTGLLFFHLFSKSFDLWYFSFWFIKADATAHFIQISWLHDRWRLSCVFCYKLYFGIKLRCLCSIICGYTKYTLARGILI